jgi:hypothetical protein
MAILGRFPPWLILRSTSIYRLFTNTELRIYFSHAIGYQYPPEDFANWTKPRLGIICGSDTDGRIARRVYEAHGTKVLNTAECGAVTVTIDRGAMSVETFRQPDADSAADGK